MGQHKGGHDFGGINKIGFQLIFLILDSAVDQGLPKVCKQKF